MDSPATNELYTPNPTYPNWIFDVIYEIKINKSAFGPAGFGWIEIPYVHASPSKAGDEYALSPSRSRATIRSATSCGTT